MSAALEIGLHAAVIAVESGLPLYLAVPGKNPNGDILDGLPFGPYRPDQHRTLDTGLRSWVEEQTRLSLGYVEQLYTFGDMGRIHGQNVGLESFVSVGYLALVRKPEARSGNHSLNWGDWYSHFPWEDWRSGPPPLLTEQLMPALAAWVAGSPGERSNASGLDRQVRFRLAFGCELPKSNIPKIIAWDEERVLERYELMYEAGLVDEAVTDGQASQLAITPSPGKPMLHDHRRILATAIARLRAKLKYRPVVFELLPESFTLTELQQTVETLSGQRLHKQNFRRMVEKAELVEPTGATASRTGGRPAAYFSFRKAVLRERPAPGLRIGSRG
ncbi:MAG: NAD regulator [Rhizobiaceae bacterium]|nr:NAD regulator [Rhizobiaceae bacterium]